MTGLIDDDPIFKKIGRKIKPIEIMGLENFPKDTSCRHYSERTVTINTWVRNAEKVAFKKIRKFARDIGSKLICYVSWSGANPDFMNGTDRTPHHYTIEARAYW